MKKSRYTETQIVKILKQVENGKLVKDVCREYGISDVTYYNRNAKYGVMEASDIKLLKDLEDENRRLKQMYADLSLEHTFLKDIIEKSCKACCPSRAGGLCQDGAWRQHSTSLSRSRHQRSGLSVSD
jgi:putative transposase